MIWRSRPYTVSALKLFVKTCFTRMWKTKIFLLAQSYWPWLSPSITNLSNFFLNKEKDTGFLLNNQKSEALKSFGRVLVLACPYRPVISPPLFILTIPAPAWLYIHKCRPNESLKFWQPSTGLKIPSQKFKVGGYALKIPLFQ